MICENNNPNTCSQSIEANNNAIRLSRVLSDFDALVSGKFDCKVSGLRTLDGFHSRPQRLQPRLLRGVTALADAGLVQVNGDGSCSAPSLQPSLTVLSLVPAPEQVKDLFAEDGPVRVSARVRDAVLRPLLPLLRKLPAADI